MRPSAWHALAGDTAKESRFLRALVSTRWFVRLFDDTSGNVRHLRGG